MKKISILMAVLFLFGATGVQAAGDSAAMAEAIMLVRQRVDIPEECTEFTGSANLLGGTRGWSCSWQTPNDAEKSASVNVSMRESGIIDEVYTYRFAEYKQRTGKILPKVSAEAAIESAYAYAGKVNPALLEEYGEGATATLYGDRYTVQIQRCVGGLPVYNNAATLQINSQTGVVENYRITHTEGTVFPATGDVMGENAARAAFMKNGYMQAEYVIFGENAALVYTPGKSNNMLHAVTGEGYSPSFSGEELRMEGSKDMAATNTASGGNIQLTPQEVQAVEEAAGLLSYEEAEEKLKNTEEFYIPHGLVLESGSTYKNDAGQYILHITLRNQNEETYARVYGELDGVSGEILYFYVSDKAEDIVHVDMEGAKAVYEDYAEKHLAEYAASLGKTEIKDEKEAFYITSARNENGHPVRGNGVSMTVQKRNGKISQYRLNWNRKVQFPSPEGMLSNAAAYDILFSKEAPKLYYYAEKETAVPVYVTERDNFAYIGAFDGAILSYSGTAYIETSTAGYTDVSGHYAEEAILALAAVGARLGDTEFKPDAVITQAEFVSLLSNCVMDYYPLYGGKADMDKIYAYVQRNGILPKEEEAPDAPLTRELATAYLLRSMGYADFATITGIFYCDFSDAEAITPSLYGYISIAKGLGIIKGDGNGCFAPEREITRGEAAMMLYNYLK